MRRSIIFLLVSVVLTLLYKTQPASGGIGRPGSLRFHKRGKTTTETPFMNDNDNVPTTVTALTARNAVASTTALATTVSAKFYRNKDAHKATIEWTYWGPNGERNWERMFKTCRGKSQSPVNIESERVFYLEDMQLTMINYDHPLKNVQMSNNGHTVKLRPIGEGRRAFVTGSALNDSLFRFVEGHFHWRNAHKAGSEHAIDGEKYSMELHLVHQNVRYEYESNSERVISAPDAFLVMAVFYNETEHTEPNPVLSGFLKHFEEIITNQTSTMINETLRLDRLIPDPTRFYRYEGSYTTPACNEIVTWIVFPTVLEIAPQQMQQFHELIRRRYGRNGDERIGFYRHIQELGTRRIYAPEEMRSGSGFLLCYHDRLLTLCIVLFLLLI